MSVPKTPRNARFMEELGLPVPEGKRFDLGEIQQTGGKRVRVWAVEVEHLPLGDVVSNQFEIEWPPGSGRQQSFPEIDKAEWVPLTKAPVRLVKAQGEFLDRLLAVRFSS